MKKLIYYIFLTISFLMILPLLFVYSFWIPNSIQYIDTHYSTRHIISDFKKYETDFERLVELKLEENESEDTSIKSEIKDIEEKLRTDCHLSISGANFIDNEYIHFKLDNYQERDGTEPGIDQFIQYQVEDQPPVPVRKKMNYNIKKIQPHWYYCTDTSYSLTFNIIVIFTTLFVLGIWIIGIIKIIKRKQKS